jgi:hypothetical protein
MAPEAFDWNCNASQVRKLHRSEVSKAEIARRLNIGRTSVRRILGWTLFSGEIGLRYASLPKSHGVSTIPAPK